MENETIGYICEWKTSSGLLKAELITTIDVITSREKNGDKFKIYLNEDSVNTTYPVYINKSNPNSRIEVVGIPSGEVLYFDNKNLNKLLINKLVKHSMWFRFRNKDYKNIFYFSDIDYKKIINFLEPNNNNNNHYNLEEHEVDDDYHIKQLFMNK